jgi:flagellar hook assembly protein FlgD
VLEIYNLSGQKIKQLLNNEMSAGKHSIQWNARNENNLRVDPGVYVCRMMIGKQTQFSKQMVLIN